MAGEEGRRRWDRIGERVWLATVEGINLQQVFVFVTTIKGTLKALQNRSGGEATDVKSASWTSV